MSAPTQASSSLSVASMKPVGVHMNTPAGTSGWFYLAGDAGMKESPEAVEDAADKASEVLSVPQLRFVQKYGEGRAKAMAATTTIVGSPARGKAGGKRGKMRGYVGKVFNPQANRPRPSLGTPYQELNVTGETTITGFTTSTSLPSYGAQAFALSPHFPDSSAYTSLFDEYRINEIEVWYNPSILMSSSVGSAPLFTAVDLDDANTPANGADVSGRQGVIEGSCGTGHYHKWKPHVATALYSGAFTSYGSVTAQWIDCASNAVQHFGIKWASPAADGIARVYNLTVRMSVSFRGPAI